MSVSTATDTWALYMENEPSGLSMAPAVSSAQETNWLRGIPVVRFILCVSYAASCGVSGAGHRGSGAVVKRWLANRGQRRSAFLVTKIGGDGAIFSIMFIIKVIRLVLKHILIIIR